MFDQINAFTVVGILIWAIAEGAVAQRMVSGFWHRSLPWELGVGAVIMVLSYLVTTENHRSREALGLLALALVVNAFSVLVARRYPAPERPFKL
jgi:hypothetical protein